MIQRYRSLTPVRQGRFVKYDGKDWGKCAIKAPAVKYAVLPYFKEARFMESNISPLSNAEAEKLKKQGMAAVSDNVKTKSVGAIIIGRVCTLFNLVNLIIATALICVGSYKNTLFMLVVLFNTAIGIIQELRAKRITDKLVNAQAPTVNVIRAEGEIKMPWSEAVKGDTVRLSEGNTVCADLKVLSGYVECDDSALTGESETISAEANMEVLSGCSIIAGSAICRITAVGKETRAHSITESTRRIKLKKSVIISKLNTIIKIISLSLIPLGGLYFAKLLISGADIPRAVTTVAASVIGMIPSGLILLTSTALAVSVIKLSSKKVLVNEMNAIEMLARTNMICLDKTGTITTGRMKVEKVIYFTDEYASKGFLAGCASIGTNATANAILEYTGKNELEITSFVPFSSIRKWSGINTRFGSFVLGAPEFILSRDSMESLKIDKYTDDYRVVCMCKSGEELTKDSKPSRLIPCCAVLLKEEIRVGAAEAIEKLQNSGVTVKIISGDNPLTAAAAAKQCGVKYADRTLDLSTLKDDADYAEIAGKFTVFGRSTPEQKKKLIHALKISGNTVSMTGDGINDLPAMKEADCAIAPDGGTDGSRSACDIVLSKNGFNDIAHIIGEGRSVINNISSYSCLFLSKTVFSFLTTLIFLLINGGNNFQPIQLTLVSTFLIGAPSFLLALMPDRSPLKGGFFKRILLTAVPAGTISAVAVAILSAFGIGGNVWAYVLAAETLAVLLSVAVPFNRYKAAVCICMPAGFILCAACFGDFFVTSLGAGEVPICLAASAISVAAYILFRTVSGCISNGSNFGRNKIHSLQDK